MPRLLLEIGCEELPAWACREAQAQLPELFRAHVGVSPDRLYVGPRRLAGVVEELPERTPDEWVKGPPEALRERAAEGFARRHGVAVEALEVRDGFLGVTVHGRPVREVLPERVDAIVRSLSFSKTMRWDDSGLRFPRPVRWVLAKLDAETVVGETSFGHRFTEGAVDVPDAASYADVMRAAGVEPDAEERRRRIVDGLDAIGGWSDPARVLEEVIHLVESPLVLEGRFDERFLALPRRVIEAPLQKDQRYFPLGGNGFAFVANGGEADVVRRGNENVLNSRLEDAEFTFRRDVEQGIERLASQLERITFFAGAGTFAEKTDRLRKLVERLGGGDASREAARLAKADQAAELVREFPTLEGYIGAEYARLAGYPEAVCAAIEEQYLPDGQDAPLPQTEAGKVLSAADKIDTLNVAFGLGHRPTGSRDPYGLRRAAIGLCRLAREDGGLTIPRDLLDDEVRDFVEERLEALLDVPVEYVRAARAGAVGDLGAVAWLAEALAALPEEQLDAIHTVYTRAARLAGGAGGDVDPALLRDEAELELARSLQSLETSKIAGRDPDAFASAASLAPVVERFFEEVLVMAEDSAVRANRLALLGQVRDDVGRLGDFSQIPR